MVLKSRKPGFKKLSDRWVRQLLKHLQKIVLRIRCSKEKSEDWGKP